MLGAQTASSRPCCARCARAARQAVDPIEGEVAPKIDDAARPLLIAAMASGNRDEGKLTDLVFYTFFRGGKREPIQLPREKALARIWQEIRAELVRPALKLQTTAERAAFIRAGIARLSAPLASAASAASKAPSGAVTPARNGRGMKAYSQQRLDRTLAQMRAAGRIALTDGRIDLFQRIADVETGGMISALNTYDSAVVSVGFMQWTLHYGKLQKWIRGAADAFRRYGIAVDPARTYRFGDHEVAAIQGAATAHELRWQPWAERFWKASLETDAIAVEVHQALDEIAGQLRRARTWLGDSRYPVFVAHYRASRWLQAIFHETYNNRPVVAKAAVRAAVARAPSAGVSDAGRFLEVFKEEVLRAYRARNEENKGRNVIEKTQRGASL
jgi:hypothetical protein